MIESQGQQTLFDDPQQLLTIRDHLSHFLQPCLTTTDTLIDQLVSCISRIPGQLAEEEQGQCWELLQELRQVSREEAGNTMALSQLTIKMIDYIDEKQHQFGSQIQKYQQNLEYLRGQLDFQTNKNISIQGDVQLFREQLIAAQNELEEIAETDGRSLDGESALREEEEREKRIQELEGELEKIQEQLTMYKFQNTTKKSEASLCLQSLAPSTSEKLFFLSRNNTRTPQPNLDQSLLHQIATLRQTIHELQLENHELQMQLPQEPFRRRDSLISHSKPLGHQLSFRQLKPDLTQKVLPHLGSIANLPNSQKICSQGPNQVRPLQVEKSVERFHTLSSQVSSKSFQVNLSQFHIDQHISNLIYVGDEEQYEGQATKTGETENSIPRLPTQTLQKSYISSGVNTESAGGAEGGQCLCGTVRKSMARMVDSFLWVRDRAVKKRIVHQKKE